MITSSLFILTFVVSTYGLPKSIPPNVGRVCGFGDFNNDRFTDIVVQRGRNLTILLYDDAIRVLEEGIFNNASIIDVGNDEVECSMGDFNGDAKLDILVSQRVSDREFKHTLWIAKSAEPFDIFVRKDLETLQSQAMAVDVNGDGQHDIFGFLANGSIYCQRITTIIDEMIFIDCSMEEFYDQRKEFFDIYPGMPHLYADVLGDLYAELVVMNRTENGYLQMVVLQRIKNNVWRKRDSIPVLQQKNIGAPIPGDFNADMKLEILVPVCQEEQCEHISHFAMWERDNGWSNISIDLGSASVISDSGSKVLFRVGDFTSDGYPDLIATFLSDKAIVAKILENVPCPHCEGNDTRKFEVRKMALIQPKEIALGTLTMSSFFDLKEDGSLDILLEYNYSGARKFSFISCEDKGDTTFLKVSVFTNCQNPNTCDIDGKPGTGISWGGACMYFTMSDGWGGSLRSTSCQQPAQTYRSLMAPYVLFGLGRSPNFVDELVVGSPRYADKMTSSWRQHSQKQIVPNSRIIMMPPPLGSTGWTSRLYVTPSTLILQSLVVITVVCIILMIVVCFLHGRERKEDRIERQQQSHRFHFDAM